MPPVGSDPLVGSLRFVDAEPGPQVGVEAVIPGIGEVVLHACPYHRRHFLPVYVETVIRLAEPAAHRALDGEHGTDVVAASLDFGDGVRGERLDRELLPVAGMEVEGIGRK